MKSAANSGCQPVLRNLRTSVAADFSVNTVLRGRLGEWLPLGGASSASHDARGGDLTSTTRHDAQAYEVWVKVEVAP